MVFSHRQLNNPPLKTIVALPSPPLSTSHLQQHSKKVASNHSSPHHHGKSRQQQFLRLMCSHLFAFFCAWQVGFFYSHMTMPCLSREQTPDFNVPHERRRQKTPPLPHHGAQQPAATAGSILSAGESRNSTANSARVILGWSSVSYDEFVGALDLGAPRQGISHPRDLNPTSGSSQVLALYPTLSSLPRHLQTAAGGDGQTQSTFRDAFSQCQVVKHIITHLGTINERSGRTCLAVVSSNTDSYHLSKWLRKEPQYLSMKKTNASKPMVPVSRYEFAQSHNRFNGNLRFVPRYHNTQHALGIASSFTRTLDEALSELQPLADQVARAGDDTVQGTIVVMVCNFGHSELFANFVCAARANGVDVSKVLLFATDAETLQLGRALNVTTYYHEQLFSSIPNSAAEYYGDDLYSRIMMSKSFASYLASETGYDFIFQDVDIIPYTPLYWSWWAAKRFGDYDLYFQEDFNGRAEYAPWIANSGCYYAKNNARTRDFFATFLWHGDKILAAGSHQAALHTVLSEHASLYGLRIKTMQEDHEKIPIGWHYHRTFELMRRILKTNKTTVYSFHMNWNVNKLTKRKFLEQMGDWYLRDTDESFSSAANGVETAAERRSCAAQPVVRCHYRDKPSVVPCRDSPAFENDAPSFW